MRHRHQTRKTHVSFIEFDDINYTKLAADAKYYGEGNSKGRKLEFDFEYCLTCGLRLLDSQPIMTRDILEDELERFVIQAKKGNYIAQEERTLQHTDFEALERLITAAVGFGRLKAKKG